MDDETVNMFEIRFLWEYWSTSGLLINGVRAVDKKIHANTTRLENVSVSEFKMNFRDFALGRFEKNFRASSKAAIWVFSFILQSHKTLFFKVFQEMFEENQTNWMKSDEQGEVELDWFF